MTPDGILQAGARLLGCARLRDRRAFATRDSRHAKVQDGSATPTSATTRIYNHRRTRPEDSPTFKVAY